MKPVFYRAVIGFCMVCIWGVVSIGFSGQLSGVYADLGVNGRDAVFQAVEEINSAGGICGRSILETKDFNGLVGAVSMDRCEDVIRTHFLPRVVNGAFVTKSAIEKQRNSNDRWNSYNDHGKAKIRNESITA